MQRLKLDVFHLKLRGVELCIQKICGLWKCSWLVHGGVLLAEGSRENKNICLGTDVSLSGE